MQSVHFLHSQPKFNEAVNVELILEGTKRKWEFSKEPEDHAAGSAVCGFMFVNFPCLPNFFKRPLCLLAKRPCSHSKKKISLNRLNS